MLHEFILGRNATQAAENIEQAWGANTIFSRTVQRWFNRFRSGHLSLEEEEGLDRPSRTKSRTKRVGKISSNPFPESVDKTVSKTI